MSDAEAALQKAIADACSKVDAGEDLGEGLRSWLESHGVAEEDIAAILAAPKRLGIYRSLVRNGMGQVVDRMMPRTRARMNAAGDPPRFDRDLAAFVAEEGPRTHYLRDVPKEFFAWAAPRWRAAADVAPYLVDLAAFELTHFVVAASPPATSPADVDLALDHPLAFAPSARRLHHAWAVHDLPPELDDRTTPIERDVHLLAYRDAEYTVRWLELTPLASAVVEKLLGGMPLGPAVAQACNTLGAPVEPALPEIAHFLADLAERGVIVGAARDTVTP